MKTKKKRTRLYSKRKVKLPKPKLYNHHEKNGFSLRCIEEADGRFSLVRKMRKQLERLIADAGCDSIQKEMLAGRAIYLASFLESQETNAVEGTEIDMGQYTQAVNALSGLLKKLGLDKKMKREVSELDDYIAGTTYSKRALRMRRKRREA